MRDVRLSLLSMAWPATLSLRPPRRRRRDTEWRAFLCGVVLTTLVALLIVQVATFVIG